MHGMVRTAGEIGPVSGIGGRTDCLDRIRLEQALRRPSDCSSRDKLGNQLRCSDRPSPGNFLNLLKPVRCRGERHYPIGPGHNGKSLFIIFLVVLILGFRFRLLRAVRNLQKTTDCRRKRRRRAILLPKNPPTRIHLSSVVNRSSDRSHRSFPDGDSGTENRDLTRHG